MTTQTKSTTFWRKTYAVEAIRLTLENHQEVANNIGGVAGKDADEKPVVLFRGVTGKTEAAMGDWIIQISDNLYHRMPHENFVRKYWTNEERMASDEKYAKIHALLAGAMTTQVSVVLNGDSEGEMDLVLDATTKKILGEL